MPRSIAAVLTLVSTPPWSESFALFESDEGAEVSPAEEDSGGLGDSGSAVMQKKEEQAKSARIGTAALRPPPIRL